MPTSMVPVCLNEPEEWRPVVGYEQDYAVSSKGRVKRLRFTNRHGTIQRERLRVISTCGNGYRSVLLYINNMKPVRKLIHRLICEAFHGPCPPGHQCGHRDGDPSNNVPSNLRWITAKENAADKHRHGTTCRGERARSAVLKEDDVRVIRKRLAEGDRGTDIANDYGVTRSLISKINVGKYWKHIT